MKFKIRKQWNFKPTSRVHDEGKQKPGKSLKYSKRDRKTWKTDDFDNYD